MKRLAEIIICAAVLCAAFVLTGAAPASAEPAVVSASGAAVVSASEAAAEELLTEPAEAPEEVCVPLAAAAADGWVYEDGRTLYYRGGAPVTGISEIDGMLFCFGTDGVLCGVDGWQYIDGKQYYILGGEVLTGCRFVEGAYTLFGDDGAFTPTSGFVGDRYYISGRAASGPQNVGGEMLLFDIAGRQVTEDGWKTVADENGALHTYYVSDGVLADGVITVDGCSYVLRSYEMVRSGWIYDGDGRRYVVDGQVVTGMRLVDGSMCFLDPSANGLMRTGWLTLYGRRYYADSSGAIACGRTFTQDGVLYAADENGAVVEGGWTTVGGRTYFAEYDGSLRVNSRFEDGGKTYIAGSDGAVQRNAMFDFAGSTYISGEDGALRYGWIKYGGLYYYAGSDGALLKNTKVDGYTLDADGKRKTSGAAAEACAIVNRITNSSMSSSQKLRTCFNWVVSNCSYKRDYADPTKLSGNWREQYALEMLTTKKGNCYRYAAAFAYLAEVLGYDAQVVCGKVSAVGGGMTPHAYTQVKVGGTSYICDANLQDSRPSLNWYMITSKQYHYAFTRQKVYEVSLD